MQLRDKIIYILESNKGDYVSGQAIATSCGVSRSAVAKCINALKSEGYEISSVNNLGHRLDPKCDILSESGIRAALGDDGTEIKVFKTIDSTSTEAKRALNEGLSAEAVFASESQTAGRGRRGKSFYSPSGSGLYFSCVLYPNASLSDSAALTSAAAVAVCKAIEHTTDTKPQIKWVNDIFIDGKKVCGILTEAVSDFESQSVQAVIIGIGINLTTDDFPEELGGIAASLGCKPDRCRLIAEIFKNIKELCEKLPDQNFMNDYRARSLVLGKRITFTRNGIFYTATAESIDDNGELSVIAENGEKMLLNSGEISVKL